MAYPPIAFRTGPPVLYPSALTNEALCSTWPLGCGARDDPTKRKVTDQSKLVPSCPVRDILFVSAYIVTYPVRFDEPQIRSAAAIPSTRVPSKPVDVSQRRPPLRGTNP